MMNRLAVVALSLALMFVGGTAVYAVDVSQTIVQLDLDLSDKDDAIPATQTGSPNPDDAGVIVWLPGQTYQTHLVLEPTQAGETIDDLVGVSADLDFTGAVDAVELVNVYEFVRDVNFDGKVTLNDLLDIFQDETFEKAEGDDAYFAYYNVERRMTGNATDTSVTLNDLLGIFQSAEFETQGNEDSDDYWTTNKAGAVNPTGLQRESVEVFDDPMLSNSDDNGGHAGFVDDLASVLLLRPDTDNDDVADDGSGFSTVPFSGSRAVIATVEWRVKDDAGAGNYELKVVAWPDKDDPSQDGDLATLHANANGPVAIASDTDVSSPVRLAAGTSYVTVSQ